MSKFREAVREILYEENIILDDFVIHPRSHEQLCKIFNVCDTVTEDVDDNESYLYIAYDYYKKLMDKIYNNEYTKTQYGSYKVEFDEFTVYISHDDLGNYNNSNYSSDYKTISVYTKDFKNIGQDKIFRSNFIHEVTHYISEFEDDNPLPWNYNKPTQDDLDNIKYYTQPTELLSNKISICDFLISIITRDAQDYITRKDLLSSENLQSMIDKMLNIITSAKGFIYHNFLKALSKDSKSFNEFYEEIVNTCSHYILSKSYEPKMYATLNQIKEVVEESFKSIINRDEQ